MASRSQRPEIVPESGARTTSSDGGSTLQLVGRPSWTELTGAEGGLEILEKRVRAVAASVAGNAEFCRQTVWNEKFEPELYELIGWARRRYQALPAGMIDDEPDVEAMLRTRAAYDASRKYLLGLLPRCQHPRRGCRW
jgi:hypothetical protein